MHRLARGLTLALVLAPWSISCGGPSEPGDGGALDGGSRDGSADAGAPCEGDPACDDGLFCNGVERCRPGDPSADALGCVRGTSPCPVDACDEAADRCTEGCDRDGDGVDSIDCGGADCDDDDAERHPGNIEVCDADDHDEDCNPVTVGSRDVDGDGYVDAACCNEHDGALVCGTDCDDSEAGVSPSGTETCNGVDDDCDGRVDEGVLITYYVDADGDGVGAIGGATVQACSMPSGYSAVDTDCDDTNHMINPSATELCDEIDNDCSGTPDEGCDCVDGRTVPCGESDGMGGYLMVGNCTPGTRTCVAGSFGPCLDAVLRAPETCAAGDEDCDGVENESDASDASLWYPDGDGDGFGAGTAVRACVAPAGHVANGTDCDDTASGINPAAAELCNGIDDDCDMSTDEPPAVTNSCTATMTGHTYACVAGSCAVASCPSSDVADCDGAYANGCEVDLRTTRLHCGACGSPCVFSCRASSCDEPTSVTAGRAHTCVRQSSGALACWGANDSFQLGDMTITERPRPVAVLGLTMGGVAVAGGQSHTCAIRSDGAAYCWGACDRGQCGSTPTGLVSSPRAVVTTGLFSAIAARHSNTCAIRTDGQALCWGANEGAQCGDGVTDISLRATQWVLPRLVSGLSDASKITVGNNFACAIRTGGGAVCWGYNAFGQLGDGVMTHMSGGTPIVCDTGAGNRDCSPTPVEVVGITSATAIAAGGAHACAIQAGQVRCWGSNDSGQLGGGTVPSVSFTPITVTGLTDATSLALGTSFSCALRAGGAVACWGANSNGQLGQGTTSAGGTTVLAVPGLTGVVSIAAGHAYACAVRSNGETWCWGQNGNGQLGDDSSIQRTSPVQVLPLH